MLLFNSYEKKFLKRLPQLNSAWAGLVIDYCYYSPFPMYEILNNIVQAIDRKVYTDVFKGDVGWEFLVMMGEDYFQDDMFKKYFNEHHFIPVLEILVHVITKIDRANGEQHYPFFAKTNPRKKTDE